MKSFLLSTIVFAPLFSFSAVKLNCEVLPKETPHKSYSFYTGFNLVVDGDQVTGQYSNFRDVYQLENDKNTFVSASAKDGVISVNVDKWIGYDNYVAHMTIQNNTGVLSSYELIDCLGEYSAEYQVVCTEQ